jgi:hypothetical protein
LRPRAGLDAMEEGNISCSCQESKPDHLFRHWSESSLFIASYAQGWSELGVTSVHVLRKISFGSKWLVAAAGSNSLRHRGVTRVPMMIRIGLFLLPSFVFGAVSDERGDRPI